MNTPIEFEDEELSNAARRTISSKEPPAQRTYTPSQAVFAKSAGCFCWTPEDRRLYDFSSGVLVTNLGHNPKRWLKRFFDYLGWDLSALSQSGDYASAAPMNAYNAVTPIEAAAVERLIKSVQSRPGGRRLNTVMWSASGSEAIQKSLWACLHRDEKRDMILATRHGFHGKKGLAGAVTGSETDHDRDPRVRFVSFPMAEVDDVSKYDHTFDPTSYGSELELLWKEFGSRISCLITEPYLGGGGSYHPPAAYLQLLQAFCRKHHILFVLDEVQANFGRTGPLFAFERYGLEPDFICLGKGLGNGIPVSAVLGRGDVMSSLSYGDASDTWSANPVSCAAVLATLDEFETTDVLKHAQGISQICLRGLTRLQETSVVTKVRGEGLVFGIECGPVGNLTANQVANLVVETCYRGKPGGDGIHFLGPLAGCVLRVAPPLTMLPEEAEASLELLFSLVSQLELKLRGAAVT